MSIDFLALNRWNIRGADTNSLLRMYDLATEVFHKSKSPLERIRNGKVVQRIAHELQKRKATW